MAGFYIKSITAYGSGKTPSTIDFAPGFNVICGPSNTGKSHVVECIDYLFGAKEPPFDTETTGFNRIVMIVETSNSENITLERVFGQNKVSVSSTSNRIDNGDYSTKTGKRKISNLWLYLIGIENEHQIIRNENYKSQSLTWRSFSHTLLIKEEKIVSKDSVIDSKVNTAKTATLSALLFLIGGLDCGEMEQRETSEVRKAKKAAVISYINQEIIRLSERNEALSGQLHSLGAIDIETEMQTIVDEITATEQKVAQASKESRILLERIYEVTSKLEECKFLQERYVALESQYLSDIKRLSFINEGESLRSTIPENEKCPFCEGELSKCEQEMYAESSRKELATITVQLKDLRETQKEVANEATVLEEEMSKLDTENSAVVALINEELIPRMDDLRQSLEIYRNMVRIQNEMEVIQTLAHEMSNDIIGYEKTEESEHKYKPRDNFESKALSTINQYLEEALTECAYENLTSARLSIDNFDIVINGKKKSMFGKGYRAFLNTVFAFVLMKYLSVHGMYAPKMLVIDSPILSLREKDEEDEQATDSMKSSLFHYLINNQDKGQIIIVENEIPTDVDYSAVNVIEFTKDDEKGRYGFLEGVRN